MINSHLNYSHPLLQLKLKLNNSGDQTQHDIILYTIIILGFLLHSTNMHMENFLPNKHECTCDELRQHIYHSYNNQKTLNRCLMQR